MQLDPSRSEQAGRSDEGFMQVALAAAQQAATAGEVPVGAVLVRDGEIIGSGHNTPIAHSDPTAHAEVVALREAARYEGNYRLPGTTLYVTVEPCMMCVGALMQARVARIVFGCWEPKGGALGSTVDLRRDPQSGRHLEVLGGICADEASALLRRFFRARRGA